MPAWRARRLATARDGLRRLPDLLAAYNPGIVVVCFGANDAHTDPGGFASGMKGILAVLKEKSIHATVITPIAFDTRERPELEESAKALAALMADLASIASSAGALYADSHTPSRDRLAAGGDDLSWGDGIHPGPRGKRAMADALQEAWKLGKPLSAWPQ